MPKTAAEIIKEQEQGFSGRRNFESYWQTMHDFFDIAAEDVNSTYYPGTELTHTQLFDSYSLETANILASGLMNYLTPPASRWAALRTKDPLKMEKKRVLHYLKDVEAEVVHALNNSNFYDIRPTYYKKSGVYGTTIQFVEEDPFDDIRFYSIPIKSAVIVEDARQRVIEYYIEFEYTPIQAVTRFGDKVHKSIKDKAEKGRDPDEKYKYTLYIGPNWERNPMALDTGNKPYIAQWIDVQHRMEVDRGGFDEMPAMTHRFYKRDYIPWGFSPAMMALPDVRVLNAMAKTQLRAAMKQTDPPVAMPHNSFLMPFNYNPRGTNYYQRGRLTRDDIFPIGNYGNPGVGMEMINDRRERIRAQMFTDVFLAFREVTKQMNNPEVFERITEKMTLLGPAVGRFMSADLDPTIHRTIGILNRRGKLPEPPPEIVEDPRYEIDYLSTLARSQKAGELQALQNAMVMVAEMANFSPEIIDKVDPDKGVDVVWGITGAPVQMLRDDDEVQQIREQRAENQAAEQRAAILGQGADFAVKATQASKNAREAEAVPG